MRDFVVGDKVEVMLGGGWWAHALVDDLDDGSKQYHIVYEVEGKELTSWLRQPSVSGGTSNVRLVEEEPSAAEMANSGTHACTCDWDIVYLSGCKCGGV